MNNPMDYNNKPENFLTLPLFIAPVAFIISIWAIAAIVTGNLLCR